MRSTMPSPKARRASLAAGLNRIEWPTAGLAPVIHGSVLALTWWHQGKGARK